MKTLETIKKEYDNLIKQKKESIKFGGLLDCQIRAYDTQIRALSFCIKNYDENKIKDWIKQSENTLRKIFATIIRCNGNSTLNQYYKETEIRERVSILNWVLS